MMAQQEEYIPERGDVLESDRTGRLNQIVYVDEQVVLLRNESTRRNGEHSHQLMTRGGFDEYLTHATLKPRPDSNLDLLSERQMDWAGVDYVGAVTAERLRDNGFETAADIRQADDKEILAVDGIGNKALENLREYTR